MCGRAPPCMLAHLPVLEATSNTCRPACLLLAGFKGAPKEQQKQAGPRQQPSSDPVTESFLAKFGGGWGLLGWVLAT